MRKRGGRKWKSAGTPSGKVVRVKALTKRHNLNSTQPTSSVKSLVKRHTLLDNNKPTSSSGEIWEGPAPKRKISARIHDLCAQDKAKIANLLKEVARQKESIELLETKALEYEGKLGEYKTQNSRIIRENSSLASKLDRSLKLIKEYQARILAFDSVLACNRNLSEQNRQLKDNILTLRARKPRQMYSTVTGNIPPQRELLSVSIPSVPTEKNSKSFNNSARCLPNHSTSLTTFHSKKQRIPEQNFSLPAPRTQIPKPARKRGATREKGAEEKSYFGGGRNPTERQSSDMRHKYILGEKKLSISIDKSISRLDRLLRIQQGSYVHPIPKKKFLIMPRKAVGGDGDDAVNEKATLPQPTPPKETETVTHGYVTPPLPVESERSSHPLENFSNNSDKFDNFSAVARPLSGHISR
ncbi:hypothetical protein AAMO2058_001502100 [Amorphochlora amoebiformis]